METVDQPNSICHIQSIHMYPLQSIKSQKPPPFGLLTGEMVLHVGNSVDGLILLTNYRLYLQNGENQHHITLGLIETVEIRELFYLQLFCKDARTYRCTFENNEKALEWYDRLTKISEHPRQIEQLFAFYHCIWAKEKGGNDIAMRIEYQTRYTFDRDMFENEMSRMQFQGDSWRITKANEAYKLCPTYPPYLLVPSCINDEMLESIAKFRSSKRIPVAVWRHQRNGAIIARCSQPEVGWLGWRSSEDEELLKAISEACHFDRNLHTNSSSDKDSVLSHSRESLHSDESLQITGEVKQQEEKLLIMDARSYTTAVANRARGGGCECPEYYPNCEIQFMNLANIHSIRKSFHSLRQLCMSSAEQPNWFSLLEGTRWLLHMSGLLKAAVTLTTAIERDGRPVLVHCSDGWDRTPQIVALAELLLDPYYRTIDGFRVLIEREWLAFGHKFADRCGQPGGSDDLNERCPVFLQWLDCVHQLMTQFPVSFELSHNYLIKLAQHTYSNLFGTFLCNTIKQRNKVVLGRTFSVWEFLSSPNFKNNLYAPQLNVLSGERILWPKTNVRDLRFWSEVYLGSMEAYFSPEEGPGSACPGPPDLNGHSNMTKTRSFGDLMCAENSHTFYGNRRSSDPNINRELKLPSYESGPNTTHSNHNCATSSNIPQSYQDTTSDFLPSDMEDNPTECNQDCIFNMHAHPTPNLTDDQIDGLDFGLQEVQTRSELLESEHDELTCALEIPNRLSNILDNRLNLKQSSGLISLQDNDHDKTGSRMVSEKDSIAVSENNSMLSERVSNDGDDLEVKGFSENNNNFAPNRSGGNDSDLGSSTDNSLEKGLCKGDEQVGNMLDLKRSVETSTETLVSELQECGGPKENYYFEKHRNLMSNTTSTNKIEACPQNERAVIATNRISTIQNGWDGDYLHSHSNRYRGRAHHCHLGEDGLIPLRSPIQERLDQILEEQRKKVELLEKELHASRQILIKQACHNCQHGECEKQDDNNSVVESVNSASEGQASAGESLRSDISWVAVEDGIVAECQGTLWVPDHAVNRCTGCGTEFWLGRRRHHCRKCGKIFCADCSEHATPLPSEQLYNPVRVCSDCYSTLKLTGSPQITNKSSESPADRSKRIVSCPQGGQRIQTQVSAPTN